MEGRVSRAASKSQDGRGCRRPSRCPTSAFFRKTEAGLRRAITAVLMRRVALPTILRGCRRAAISTVLTAACRVSPSRSALVVRRPFGRRSRVRVRCFCGADGGAGVCRLTGRSGPNTAILRGISCGVNSRRVSGEVSYRPRAFSRAVPVSVSRAPIPVS